MKNSATDRAQKVTRRVAAQTPLSSPFAPSETKDEIEKLGLAVTNLPAAADEPNGSKMVGNASPGTACFSRSEAAIHSLDNGTLAEPSSVRDFLLTSKFKIWTIIVAAFGDVVEPRGGAISLGNLTDLFGVLGVDSGVLRTVLARLASDGCLLRHRRGRRSFYELTEWALTQSREVAQRVYRLSAPSWNGSWHLIVPSAAPNGTSEETAQVLRQLGFGVLHKGVFIAPLTEANNRAEEESGGFGFIATLKDPDQARGLVSAAWDLNHLAALYEAFIKKWGPLERDLDQLTVLSDLEALALRVLIIYELRRAVLQDPDLPDALLDHKWPGADARKIAARIWRALTRPSERWLSKNGEAMDGALPPANTNFMRRFLF